MGGSSKGVMHHFICLVPKKENLVKIEEFWPISLIGYIYKIITKLLAARLKKVMDPIISRNQTAFLKGRQILNEPVILNEIIDEAKKKRKPCAIFKIDFKKAYDSVNWEFLEYMLRRMGFLEKMVWLDYGVRFLDRSIGPSK